MYSYVFLEDTIDVDGTYHGRVHMNSVTDQFKGRSFINSSISVTSPLRSVSFISMIR